jgi:predicted alpha/beta-fold hydrolase
MSYVAPRWLPNGHVMTIWGSLVRLPARLPVARERWELADGDFLDVDRLAGATADAPLVVILHGLEGSSKAGYVRGVMGAAHARGLGAVAINFRGCSGELNRLPRFYHSGETGDLALVIERLAAERPNRALGLVGFSLGGNVVAKFLGERGDDVPPSVRAAAVVSVPFDLAACARALDAPGFAAWIYRERFLRRLRKKALTKRPPGVDLDRTRAAKGFWEFDDAFTAPLHGFRSADEYYARASSGPLVGNVRRPLLVITSDDDPLVPAESLPGFDNPQITLDRFHTGGHVAFVDGPPWRPRRWAERRVVEFLEGRL